MEKNISNYFYHTYSLRYKYQEDKVIHTLLYDNKNTTDENMTKIVPFKESVLKARCRLPCPMTNS